VPTSPAWLDAISATDIITTIIWVVALIGFIWKGIPFLRRMGQIADMILGAPAQPHLGIPERPSLGARVTKIETASQEAAYHSKPNGGGSFADNINRRFDEVRADMGELSKLVGQHAKALSFLSADEPDDQT
jgi:hypothetical protein